MTHSWLRLVWEKIDLFGFKVEIHKPPLQLPRENDGWIMRAFAQLGFDKKRTPPLETGSVPPTGPIHI